MDDVTRPGRLLTLPRPGAPPEPRVPVPARWTMTNGLRVVAVPRRNIPHVAMRLIVPAGASADPADRPGTAAFVAAMLTEGTASRTADELNARLDWLGASLGAQAGQDFAELDLVSLSDTLEEAVEMFAEVLLEPGFPERETERTRLETLDTLVARSDEPANVADDTTAEAVFGADHPYGRLTMGSVEGVSAVTTGELAAFHRARYRPGGAVLIAAGDFDPDALAVLLERALGDWTGSADPIAAPAALDRALRAGESIRLVREGAAQGEIRFAGVGMPRSHEDWIHAAVANYLLGGSTITGRLGANLREDKGWTYGARSGFAAALHAGGWVVDTAVDLDVVDDAIREITTELARFTSEPVTEDELHRGKQALILSLPRAFETPGRIIGRFGTLEAYGLEQDYWDHFADRVQAVSRDDVLAIARKYFSLDRLVRVAVGVPA